MEKTYHSMIPNAENYTKTLMANGCDLRQTDSITDETSLIKWQNTLHKKLWNLLGLNQIASNCHKTSTLKCEKRDEITQNDHIREEWAIETEPDFHIPFFLLRPHKTPTPCPLVLTPHGHSHHGRETYAGLYPDDPDVLEGERDIALQAVREGYVAIAPEMRGFGESRWPEDQQHNHVSSCLNWQLRAQLFGRTLIGERVWDMMRLIDFATTRPEVNADKIIITGNSGGGTTSLYTAAIDKRIGLCAAASCFSTFLDSIGAIEHCACNYVPNLLTIAEIEDIAGLIAPRHFLAVHGQLDPIFPINGTQKAFDRLQEIYHAAGVKSRCKLFIGDKGHQYYKKPVWDFVRNWLIATRDE